MTLPVAITGVGVVSPYGIGWPAFRDGVLRGESRTSRVSLFDPEDLPCSVVAEVPDFRVEEHLSRADLARLPRLVPIARSAAREAIADAGLDLATAEARREIDVVIGSAGGGIEVAEREYRRYFAGDVRRTSPYAIASSIVGMLASEICLDLGLTGRSHVLSNGCTSAADAMGYAIDLVRSGRSRRVLTGGADACITPGILAGYARMGVIPTTWNDRPSEASRPFAQDRDGFVLGEGAWFFLIEREDEALARSAHARGLLLGYGASCDALHRVAPLGPREEAARAVRMALDDASREANEVEYVALHGTATRAGDAAEFLALELVLRERLRITPMGAVKATIGHPQGASAAASLGAVLAAFERDLLPPTPHLESPDPELPLDLVVEGPRAARITTALVHCLGFGSKNAALVVGRAEDHPRASRGAVNA